jgi:murein DD-endopeptidase MepM/ murein hydrolase activator NlpD
VKKTLLLVATGFGLSLLLMARGVWVGLAGHQHPAPQASTDSLPPQAASTPRVLPAPPVAPDPGPLLVRARPADDSDLALLRARSLGLPVEGLTGSQLRDTFADARSGHRHEALDVLAPRGTPVRAVDDGRVVKLFNSVRGGITVYQFDPTETFCYYYAHLDGYAPGLMEGAHLTRGAVVGFVGTTGNAPPNTPHLHFAVFKLGPEKHWWEGTPINPFPIWTSPG